jgi:hypothetical protein
MVATGGRRRGKKKGGRSPFRITADMRARRLLPSRRALTKEPGASSNPRECPGVAGRHLAVVLGQQPGLPVGPPGARLLLGAAKNSSAVAGSLAPL